MQGKEVSPKDKDANTSGAESAAKRSYSYLLEFRCRGTLVFSEKTDQMGECVTIGHDPKNDWVIPPEDKTAADFHAQLRLGLKDASIVACKGENFRYKGKLASQRKLAPGDRIAIGDCELLVSYANSDADRPCDVHRLEFLNGDRAGEMVRLEKATIKIGSAKDNDIVIPDDVVSGHHAELKIAPDGETWLRDLNSQNGTFVNGAKMGKTERMLMDSDVVSVAFYDLRFLDRNVIHTRTNVSKKLLAILITLFASTAIFWIFYSLTPNSENVLGEYDQQLKSDNFAGARTALSQLPYSRDFKKFAAEYPEYKDALSRYETVFQVYNDFKNYLANSNWTKATACIGLLNLDNQVDWNWNEAHAAQYMHEAALAKTCLIQMYALSGVLSDTNLPPERMKLELSKFQASEISKPDFAKSAPEYLKPLCKLIEQKASDIKKNLANLAKLDSLLNGINWESADFSKVLEQIRTIEHESMGGVRMKAQNAGDLLRKIRGNIDQVKKNQENFYNLNFGKIDRDIDFISADECLNYAPVSNLRSELVSRNELIIKNIDSLKYIISNLGVSSAESELFKEFNSQATWEELLSFNSLKNPPFRKSKSGFADEYDRLLGFKYFYDVISQIPSLSTNVFSNDTLLPEEYHPQCVVLLEAYKSADEALAWLNLPENNWMLKGKIAELKDRAEGILKSREQLLSLLTKISEQNPQGRKFFVAKAAYFYFASPGSVSKSELEDFANKWRKFRQSQYSIWEKYNPVDSGNMQRVRSEILSNGIPGDPIVNSLWK